MQCVVSSCLRDQLLVLGVQGQFPFAHCVISSCLLDQLLVLGVQGQFPFAQCVISSFVRPVTSVRCTRAVSVCAVCHQFVC